MPKFFTEEDEVEEVIESDTVEADDVKDTIWSLSERSNKNSPRQELGRAPNTSEQPVEGVPVYRALGEALGATEQEGMEEGVHKEVQGGCPYHHTEL